MPPRPVEMTNQNVALQQQQINVSVRKAQLKIPYKAMREWSTSSMRQWLSLTAPDQVGSGAVKFDRTAFNQAILESFAKHNEGAIAKETAKQQAAAYCQPTHCQCPEGD